MAALNNDINAPRPPYGDTIQVPFRNPDGTLKGGGRPVTFETQLDKNDQIAAIRIKSQNIKADVQLDPTSKNLSIKVSNSSLGTNPVDIKFNNGTVEVTQNGKPVSNEVTALALDTTFDLLSHNAHEAGLSKITGNAKMAVAEAKSAVGKARADFASKHPHVAQTADAKSGVQDRYGLRRFTSEMATKDSPSPEAGGHGGMKKKDDLHLAGNTTSPGHGPSHGTQLANNAPPKAAPPRVGMA